MTTPPFGSPIAELQPVVEAWRLCAGLHRWHEPAREDTVASVERALERTLPPELRAVYELSDGCELLEGNLNLWPLDGGTARDGVLSNATGLRERWMLPWADEAVVVGDNGGDEHFALWLPRGQARARPTPVLEIGEIFGDEAAYAVAATSVTRFLRGRTAYYLLLLDAPGAALDALGVPADLRLSPSELDDDAFAAVLSWADPELPDPNPDPYTSGLTAADLCELFSKDA